MITVTPPSDKLLLHFKSAHLIATTGKGLKGESFGHEGRLNQAAWAGEHCDILLNEIYRLRRLVAKSKKATP